MKNILPVLCLGIVCSLPVSMVSAQNVGIGTASPATRLDVAGINNWDLTTTEGDMRIGNNSYRIKMGIATTGGGAGGAAIMQYGSLGGYNVLSLGSMGNNILRLNGNLNRAGIGIDVPEASLEIRSGGGFSAPQLQVTQTTSDFGRIRFKNLLAQYWDIAALQGGAVADDRLNFYNSRTGAQFGINGHAALLLNNSAGTTGQVIQSNGTGAAATWVSSTNTLYNNTGVVTAGLPFAADGTPTTLLGMAAFFSSSGNSKLTISFNIHVSVLSCAFCTPTRASIDLVLDGTTIGTFTRDITNGTEDLMTGTHFATLPAGNHTLELKVYKNGPAITFAKCCTYVNNMVYQVIPQ